MNIKTEILAQIKSFQPYFLINSNQDKLPAKLHIEVADKTIKLKISTIAHEDIKVNAAVILEINLNKDFREILQNGWMNTSDSRIVTKVIPSKSKFWFNLLGANPYSLKEEFGHLRKSLISEWYTQIVYSYGSIFLGATTIEKQYSQFFIAENPKDIKIRATSQLDETEYTKGQRIHSEEITLYFGSTEETRIQFANDLAKKYGIQNHKPFNAICCNYYIKGNSIDHTQVEKTVNFIEENDIKVDYLQIDAGYSEWGDWLNWKKNFPYGLQANYKKDSKLNLGIWTAPISTKNTYFDKVKEYLISEKQIIFADMMLTLKILGVSVIDISDTKMRDEIKTVYKTFKEHGVKLFKIDFLYFYGYIKKFKGNITRAEALRQVVKDIREVVGDDSYILSALSQLSPLVGLVNGARTGVDSSFPWVLGIKPLAKLVNNFMLKRNIRTTKNRLFLNNIVWKNDIDCILLNSKSFIRKNLMRIQTKIIKENSLNTWLGDDLTLLSKQQIMQLKSLVD
jgi:hypothetical protein